MIRFAHAGRTALITGGLSAIALATAALLARSGVTVALNFPPSDRAGPEAVARLRARNAVVIAAPGRVTDPDEAAGMVEQAVQRLGRLDLLVNSATALPARPPAEPAVPGQEARAVPAPEASWAAAVDASLLGPFRCTTAAAPALRQALGAVVNVMPEPLPDAAATLPGRAMQAGLASLTRDFARALAPAVRVNAVAPGVLPSAPAGPAAPGTRPARRLTPDDVAEAIVFLGTSAAMVTGQMLVVDGGLSL